VTRRELLWLASSGILSGAELNASGPQNLSYPLRMVEGSVTAANLLFVRDHFREPDVSLDTWQLRVEGQVERPYELGFADLVELPSRRVEAVLECAGNAANGSAVSNGRWEGVPSSHLLDSARPAANAAFVLLEGADTGSLLENAPPLPYSQVVPIEKCRDESSLVAFKFNDLTLPKRNGFPARALFPGWYGMDSVKWLRRIVLLGPDQHETSFDASGMNRFYNRVTGEKTIRLSTVQVKSVIAWPTDALKLAAGRYESWGCAGSGAAPVRKLAGRAHNG